MRKSFMVFLIVLVLPGGRAIAGAAAQRVISEQVSFQAEDGFGLTGRLDRPESEAMRIGIILIHGGFSGNNSVPFVARIPHMLASDAFAVLSPNMRRGATFATSVFEESVKDIQAAVQYMKGRGFTSIFLAGHSTGALEVAYYVAHTQDQAIVALGLYAAAPNLNLGVSGFLGEQEYNRITNAAKELVAKGRSYDIAYSGPIRPGRPGLPASIGPLSARTWLSWFGPESNVNTLKWIESISIPVLILVHERDGPLAEWNKRYYENAKASRKADLKLYTTAPTGNVHFFQGLEDRVLKDTTELFLSIRY